MLEKIGSFFSRFNENISESWDSLKQHRTRNILTGFGVAWGILILIVLLGAGEGLQNGMMKFFGNYAQNSIWFYGGTTSEVHEGQTEGKTIKFDSELVADFSRVFPEIDEISPEKISGSVLAQNKHQTARAQLYGVNPGYFSIKLLKTEQGRILNRSDYSLMRKVAVIGDKLAEEIFQTASPIGAFVEANGTWFKVVGVLKSGSMFSQGFRSSIIISMPLYQESMSSDPIFDTFGLTLKKGTNTARTKEKMKQYLARRLNFSAEDNRALFIADLEEQVESFNKLFAAVKLFLWFLGASLLISGVVGISNIMFIVVKERTREIGIRKALGATPQSILGLIITESLVVTGLSGLLGMLLGMGIIQLINGLINSSADDKEQLIESININIPIALIAIITIVLAGSIAGLFPARKAADVKPVEAINQDAN
jgi:putative ABC transport system permease protein